ncbi:MAG: hypothetical protein SFW09_01720 [Hyphomicrobiaceae bacterium]|nr:hypothetical protein [Hyphomicrobiaceae bacterium]
MGRFALLITTLCVGLVIANNGIELHEGLEDKLALVALLPGVYILGLALLRD